MRGLAFVSAAVLCAACSSSSPSGSGGSSGGGAYKDPGPFDNSGSSPAVSHNQYDYPSAPYGFTKGQVLPPTLKWSGYANGATSTTDILITDLFDPDGSKGINAIWLDTSATWCGACQQEAAELEGQIRSSLGAAGVVVVTLMAENASHQPATPSTAKEWSDQYHLVDVAVCADPNFTMSHAVTGSTTIGLPLNVVVDPRTMKVVDVIQGEPAGGIAGDATLQSLVRKNKPQ